MRVFAAMVVGCQSLSPWCSFQYTEGLLRAARATLDQIVRELDAGHVVVNRSALNARYDVELRWTPNPGAAAECARRAARAGHCPPRAARVAPPA